MRRHIFISYARTDRAVADRLKDALSRAGRRLWMDTENLKVGGNWADDIDDAIQNASVVVVLFSRAAAKSSYVTYEWSFARGVGIPVLPVVLDGATPHPRLTRIHRIEAASGKYRWQHVLRAVSRSTDERQKRSNRSGTVLRPDAPEKGPQLIAEFELSGGKPIVEDGHYWIWLGTTNTPRGTSRVNYELLDNTFDEDERKYWVKTTGGRDFYEHIETYGNFNIASWGAGARGKWRAHGTLVQALNRKYGPRPPAPIARAIKALDEA